MRRSIAYPASAALVAAFLAVSCSSAPKAPSGIFESRNQAAQFVQLGAKALREGSMASAKTFYTEAYRLYTATDEAEGRIRALDGLGRLPDADTAALWQTASRVAADSGAKRLIALAALLDAELRLRNDEPEEARKALAASAAAAGALSSDPRDQARAFRVAGSAAKSLGQYPAALDYFDKAASIDQKEKAFTEYASDRYLAASVHSKLNDFAAARAALREALASDRRAEYAAGIGGDYFALALVAEKAGEYAAAAGFFERAAEVFTAARLEDKAAEAEKRRAALGDTAD